MSDEPDKASCQKCGRTFDRELLKHASMPDHAAIAATGIEPDEPPVNFAAFVDKQRYCPRCRAIVNTRRAALIAIGIISVLLGAYLATVL